MTFHFGRYCIPEWKGAWPTLRGIASLPAPRIPGLVSRYWRREGKGLEGLFLFRDEHSWKAFSRQPDADPAYSRIVARGDSFPSLLNSGKLHGNPGRFDTPVFIVSAPRAGSTLLYELLLKSQAWWTLDSEGEGPIEGIPGLHPANRGYASHRLSESDVDSGVPEALHAGYLLGLRDAHGIRFIDLPENRRPASVRFLEKTPENSLRVAFLAGAFPDARFIFLHRDARENVSSIIEAWRHDGFLNIPALPGWSRGGWNLLLPEGWQALRNSDLMDIAAFQWAQSNHHALEDLESLPRTRWHVVEYAELIAAPQQAVRGICEFAGIPLCETLLSALSRPLPVASTALSPPSALKWRHNPDFSDAGLEPYTLIRARLRNLGALPHALPALRSPVSPVRFAVFLDGLEPSPIPSEDWVVAPSFRLQEGESIPLGLAGRARFRGRFQSGFPIAWLEEPGTRFLYPFWLRREHLPIFRRLSAGCPPSPSLRADIAGRMANAGLLVAPDDVHQGAWRWESAPSEFKRNRYCLLPSLIKLSHIRAMKTYFDKLAGSGAFPEGDEQVRLRQGFHNEILTRYIHYQLLPSVQRIVGEPVKPSYTYVSAYKEGAVLRPHVDRKQCEFTLSLWVTNPEESGPGWPLWFRTESGPQSVVQAAGDAVLFRGCELVHWRNRPPRGGASTTLLFHYVPESFQEILE